LPVVKLYSKAKLQYFCDRICYI